MWNVLAFYFPFFVGAIYSNIKFRLRERNNLKRVGSLQSGQNSKSAHCVLSFIRLFWFFVHYQTKPASITSKWAGNLNAVLVRFSQLKPYHNIMCSQTWESLSLSLWSLGKSGITMYVNKVFSVEWKVQRGKNIIRGIKYRNV